MHATVYSRENCPDCDTAIRLLVEKNFKVDTFKVAAVTDEAEKLISKERLLEIVPTARSVPQIFIEDEYVGGLRHLQMFLAQ